MVELNFSRFRPDLPTGVSTMATEPPPLPGPFLPKGLSGGLLLNSFISEGVGPMLVFLSFLATCLFSLVGLVSISGLSRLNFNSRQREYSVFRPP